MSQVFYYKARDLSGRLVKGKVAAVTPAAAVSALREQNLYAVRINRAHSFKPELGQLPGSQVRVRDLAIFCRQFATLSAAGVPLLQCLHTLIRQTENRKLRGILRDTVLDIEKGNSLSEAFRKHQKSLPEFLINMLVAGEVSGMLDQALERLAACFEKEHHLREKLRSALVYPYFVAGMSLLTMIFLLVLIVPYFVDIFSEVEAPLPLPTRVLIRSSTLLTGYWRLILPVLVVLWIGAQWLGAAGKARRFSDRLLLGLPVVGPLFNKTVVARFARTLATLLRSGVPLMQSLEVVAGITGNTIASEEISRAGISIREGEGMAPVFARSKIFPPLAVNMIAVGEESGALDILLEKVAAFYEQEVEALIVRLSGLVEPVFITCIGIMVGFVALSIYLPLFGLSGVLQGGVLP